MVVDVTDEHVDLLLDAERFASEIVWATLATVGPDGRPRTRVVHPVWWFDTGDPATGGIRGLVGTRPTAVKRRHLAACPFVSVSYWGPSHHTVVFDCAARWLAADERPRAWAAIAAAPEPLGYDPAPIWPGGPTSDDFAVVELRPHRMVVRAAGQPGRVWRAPTA